MNKKIILALTGLAVLLIGCNSGSSPSDNGGGGSGGTKIGNYTMSVYASGSGFNGVAGACKRTSDGGYSCDKNKRSTVTVIYSLKGSPNFYVDVVDPEAGITIEQTPYDYKDVDDNVVLNGACNNLKEQESSIYSCETTLNYTAGALSAESAEVKFKIKGSAGEDNLFTVKYE